MKIQPVIMSGGSGTRLWPMSRVSRPKQFLKIASDKTMFQETVLRVCAGADYLDPVVIAGGKHGAIVAEQLSEIGVPAGEIILEPCARNTAAVAAVAASWADRRDDNALILLMPADHHIADPEGFCAAVHHGARAAADGYIVTFGIKPTTAHTGYGYIESSDQRFPSVYGVAAFREKPDAQTAQKYLADGGYYWNAGIFLFSAAAMLAELGAHAPDIRDASIKALDASVLTGAARKLDETLFATCPSDSIDYAVMEKTSKAAVVAPVDVGWTDIGSWGEVADIDEQTPNVLVDSENLICRSTGPLIATAGVQNLIIIATDDAVLVADRDNAQDVRKIVEELKKRGRLDLL